MGEEQKEKSCFGEEEEEEGFVRSIKISFLILGYLDLESFEFFYMRKEGSKIMYVDCQ